MTVSRIAAAALLVAATTALADPIATDRPDVVESSKTVGTNRLQIETSFARERNTRKGANDTTWATPTLLRWGVAADWELRFETDGYTRVSDGAAMRGLAEASIGTKWQMQDGDGAVPAVAWLLHVEVPSGSRKFRGRGLRPSLRTVFEWELPDDYSAGLMPGIALDNTVDPGGNGQRHGVVILAGVVGKAWTDTFRTFAEVAGRRIAKSRHGGSQVTVDIGAAYLLTNDVQVDTAFAWGANRNTANSGLTLGLSMRF